MMHTRGTSPLNTNNTVATYSLCQFWTRIEFILDHRQLILFSRHLLTWLTPYVHKIEYLIQKYVLLHWLTHVHLKVLKSCTTIIRFIRTIWSQSKIQKHSFLIPTRLIMLDISKSHIISHSFSSSTCLCPVLSIHIKFNRCSSIHQHAAFVVIFSLIHFDFLHHMNWDGLNKVQNCKLKKNSLTSRIQFFRFISSVVCRSYHKVNVWILFLYW